MQAKKDQNHVSTLLGVSSVDLLTPTLVAVNPATGAILAEGTITPDPASPDTSVQFNDGGSFGGSSEFTFTTPADRQQLNINALTAFGYNGTDSGVYFNNNTRASGLYIFDGEMALLDDGVTPDTENGTNINIISSNGGSTSGSGGAISMTAGSAQGGLGVISTVSVIDTGGNYQVKDVITIVGGNNDATLTVLTLTGSSIATVEITTAGTGYSKSTTTGIVTGAYVDTAGTGYTVNDVLTLIGGNNDCTVTVTGVTGGAIDSISLTTPGTGYTNNASYGVTGGTGNDDAEIWVNADVSLVTGGNGTGATFTIDSLVGEGDIGGNVTIIAGAGSLTSGNGGSISLTAGSAQGGDSDGGSITQQAGTGIGEGKGGNAGAIAGIGGSGATGADFFAEGGDQNNTGDGGRAFLEAGFGADVGNGGSAEIQGGTGGATSGNGGSISLTAGSAQGGDSDGGSLTLRPGSSTGGGADGKIKLTDAGGDSAILDTSSIASSDKTFTFPNTTGTLAVVTAGSALVASGTYTPTRSAEVNLDANVTMSQAQYMRVGDTVTVSGRFTADPTLAATTTSFEITLPVASNLGAAEDVAGTAFCGNIAGMGAEVIGVAANDTAKVQWKSSDVTSQTWSYIFSYQAI